VPHALDTPLQGFREFSGAAAQGPLGNGFPMVMQGRWPMRGACREANSHYKIHYKIPDKKQSKILPNGFGEVKPGSEQQEIHCPVEGFGGEAGDLPLYQQGGGSALCV
jgi:hypothetical protein